MVTEKSVGIVPAQKGAGTGNTLKIVRFSKAVFLGNGTSNMTCRIGTEEEVRQWAEQIAEENHAKVEAVV